MNNPLASTSPTTHPATRVIQRLNKLLRPAGGGIYTVSTGVEEQRALQRQIYGSSHASEQDIQALWHEQLCAVDKARVAVLAVPSDVGAGYGRGASFGPQALRRGLLRRQMLPQAGVVDAGDVFVVPQLLLDDMLSSEQVAASRAALYNDADGTEPVSPLSIAETAIRLLLEANPNIRILLLGGDHSVAWPLAKVLGEQHGSTLGILHFDAHTDLLKERLGVRYCFATWAYHANDLVGRDQRLQQVGIRISRHNREHWERELGVRQHWAADVRARTAKVVAQEIVETLKSRGVDKLYISNDIDGTDPEEASATGTPEPNGLLADEVVEITQRVGEAFTVVASDLVEVAPVLNTAIEGEPERTIATACRYLGLQLALMLR